MATAFEPAVQAELDALIRAGRMIDAVKHLREQGMDHRSSKEIAERRQRDLDPDAATAREKWLDTIIEELGNQKE